MSQPGSVSLDLPADVGYLHVPGACLAALLEGAEDLPTPEDLVYNLQLALYEICTNIVRHAYNVSGRQAEDTDKSRIRIVFTLTSEPPLLIVDFFDTGSSFDISLIPEPDTAEPQTGGYGLYLVCQLVDEVTYQVEPDRNHWRLAKHL